ncbi:alpha/beta hydrolase family protein [Hirsutella rhossiliensis]|uniref:Alpha/beta hydrolase family domain-containing protein n=1 Tax=Hirsutella rhossiliensis TaxID=111463 RepID=A0A9P8N3B0_9HYPO|nr:alpha/beta hydrolase family domain-containing protein [Hirsutella rhossiliensis]KAH0966039.1 alpha/beta hydrolase family domain-containing protein [Hirsutella rhossiliensis]
MLASALLLGLATAVAAKNCVDLKIPLYLRSRNGVFDMATPKTEIEVTNFILDYARNGRNYTNAVTTGFKTIKGNYKLAATYCEPDWGARDTLQIVTHGIGFDRSYWDFPYKSYNYSYVNRALDQGYSVLSWDRLGIAHSSHGDPIDEIQIFLAIAALEELTKWVKHGKLQGGKHKYSKMVHIGHSFGSAITLGMTSANPELSDAIVLSGFSQVPSFLAQFLLGANFISVKGVEFLAPKYSEGYLASKSTVGLQTNFFAPGDFDPKILGAAAITGQPAAIGELMTLGSVSPQSNFKGPVLIVTGERDVPFCGGDCTKTDPINHSARDLLQASKRNFKSASVFKTVVIPGAGHGLNYQYSAPLTYRAILNFIKTNVKDRGGRHHYSDSRET